MRGALAGIHIKNGADTIMIDCSYLLTIHIKVKPSNKIF